MTESELIGLWVTARWHIIVSQFAPTFLLAGVVGLSLVGLAEAPLSVRVATAGILLASGMFGAAAQLSAANESLAVIADLRALAAVSEVSTAGLCIIASARGVNVVRYGAPAIFVIVFLALLTDLFVSVA